MNRGDKRYLVLSRAGDCSLHKQWIAPALYKNFDLFLDYYGDEPNRFANECDFYSQSKGTKYPAIFNIIKQFEDRIFEYDAVWFPDDDISTNALNINRMFQLFSENQLWLAQPALSKDSYFSWPITIQNASCKLRYTNFVEAQVPIFSKGALKLCWESFQKSVSAWGLDFAWPKLLGHPRNKIAIIDATPVRHTRPVGGGEIYQTINVNPHEELKRVTREYNVHLPYRFLTYGMIPGEC